jgi:DNA-binding transcriptional regulator YhcF (GntR family)
MSRLSPSRQKAKPPRHVRLYHWMMNSEAWQSLDPVARAVYIEIASRYAGPGSNNGRIPYSVREAADALRIGKATAHRAIAELEERGFIVATRRGAFSWKTRHCTEWRLTEYGCDLTHALATKDFMKWSPEKKMPVPIGNRTVSVAEPDGTCSRTETFKKRPTVSDMEPCDPILTPLTVPAQVHI